MSMTQTGAPWLGSTAQQLKTSGLNDKPNAPFYLSHHPEQWDLVVTDGVPEFLPKFAKLKEEPGINGVRQTKTGPDSGLARVYAQDNGKTVLPWSLGYLTRYPTKSGGFRYVIKWNTPKTVAGRVLWQLDTEGYNNFRRGLMVEGILEAPDPDLIDILIEQEQRNIDRLVTMQHIPEMARQMGVLKQRIEHMRTALQPPTPKKRARK